MSDPKPAQFRKTKTGKWAVMAPVESLEKALKEDGGVVQVLKKSGDYSTFTVGSLGKAFDVDGEQMCYGYSPEDSEDSDGTRATSSRSASQQSSTGEWPAASDADPSQPGTVNLDAPPADSSEPMPEFQGGSDDEWDGGF